MWSIATTCIKQKAGITLKHRAFQQKIVKLCCRSNREIIISYEEDFVEFEQILKTWDILNLPFFFLFLPIEMPLLNRNKRNACFECGREYTRKDASRHQKHCDVLKWSNCNFYTFSSEELTNHIKMKQCQYNVKVCAWQSQKTLQEKVKLIYF